jgi:hypothetical protein
MSLKIFEKKRPISFSPNDDDLDRMKAIVEQNELSETISNSDFLRKVVELAANPKTVAVENSKSSEETELLKDELALLKADFLEEKSEKKKLQELLDAKPEVEPKEVEAPKPIVEKAINEVSISIDARMQKALSIRQKYDRSNTMEEMVSQATQYCINQPIGNLFTGQW